MKTVIITDIHGCRKELELLFRKCGFHSDRDFLICLGDLTDRGPDSYGVYCLMRSLQAEMGERCVLLKGNHDDMLAQHVSDPVVLSRWMRNDGASTMQSFKAAGENVRDHCLWFEALALWYETDEFICAHAGLVDPRPERNSAHDLIWDRTLADGAIYAGKLLFYGHTPMYDVFYRDETQCAHRLYENRSMRLPERGSVNLDTGCVYGGRLTAAVIEDGMLTIRSQECLQPGGWYHGN